MGLKAPSGNNTSRAIAPEGAFVARCYQIVDLGTTMQTGHYLGLQSRVTCLAAMQNLVLVTNAEMQCASEHLFGFTALSHFAMSPLPSSAKISNPFQHNILSFVPN